MDVDQPGQGGVAPQVDHLRALGDGHCAGADARDAVALDHGEGDE
jgi:hypothetical protein